MRYAWSIYAGDMTGGRPQPSEKLQLSVTHEIVVSVDNLLQMIETYRGPKPQMPHISWADPVCVEVVRDGGEVNHQHSLLGRITGKQPTIHVGLAGLESLRVCSQELVAIDKHTLMGGVNVETITIA